MTHHLTDRITEQKSQLKFSDELKEEATYSVLILRKPIQKTNRGRISIFTTDD